MGISIVNVTISKNPVNTSEQFKVTVVAKETAVEPKAYRLPYKLGETKGGLK